MKKWHNKIGTAAQVGGIETSVLDDGPGSGVRVAWVNTGSPLRYRVVPDRALDIVEAFYGEHSLAWLSPTGICPPSPAATHGLEWLHSFAGGLVTTCGLSHIGAPETSDWGEQGLHGRISNAKASVTAIEQPDLSADQPAMRIAGTVREARTFGPSLELRREISSPLGQATIAISDTVTNIGNQSVPMMLLYHCNFGWPLVDEGAELFWSGTCRSLGRPMDDARWAVDGVDIKRCPAPIPDHRGSGESCGVICPEPDDDGLCRAGVRNSELGIALTLSFKKEQLPCATNWQHWGANDYVTAIEPGTNPPIGQTKAAQDGSLIMLEPGESRPFGLRIDITSQ